MARIQFLLDHTANKSIDHIIFLIAVKSGIKLFYCAFYIRPPWRTMSVKVRSNGR